MSFFSRMSVEMGNALSDAYGNLMYGDDAGKSAKLVFVAKPRANVGDGLNMAVSSRFHLGVTFLEVNGRAYVRSVAQDSAAELSGIQPRDCVQFAMILGGELESMREDDKKAALFALECEKRGARTSFCELKSMFADCVISEEVEEATELESFVERRQPSASETLRVSVATATGCGEPPRAGEQQNNAAGRFPVVLVFRRTRKRQSFGGLVPIGIPSFRLDDECDRAAVLVRRLAPTAEMTPEPDAWDEIVHDGTEWLLPSGSIMPPRLLPVVPSIPKPFEERQKRTMHCDLDISKRMEIKRTKSGEYSQTEETIPKDIWETKTSAKLHQIRSRMHAEAIKNGNHHRGGPNDLEAATIRGLIQKAVGLAFVRTSKVVLGVSLHGGSGIIIARLTDGTWSAPSAIGVCGAGLGLQFGLEVADYIFILQTEECLSHFRRGGNFTVGGNVGAAIAGFGRNALGAASVGGRLCTPRKPLQVEEKEEGRMMDFAPIVAYGRSQGLYFGVSLEGSRIFTREDINARTYKFTTGKGVTSKDILNGKVPTPPEAEDLYASLHSVEFTHEISGIPRPPEILRRDSPNNWRFDRSTLTSTSTEGSPFSFLSTIDDADAEECSAFETSFKKFLYGGVSVQRLVLNAITGGKTCRERRTLWLMLPEVGALRLGFVSKLNDDGEDSRKRIGRKGRYSLNNNRKAKCSDGEYSTDSNSESLSNDDYTITSGEVSADTNVDSKTTSGPTDEESQYLRTKTTRNVHLSNKHSLALTDVTILSQDPNVSIRFSPDDATEHLRVISIRDVSGTSLLFLADNFREAELLVCGLKLLLERESVRLGVRGGVSITQLGGKAGIGAMSPAQARGGTYINGETPTAKDKVRSTRRRKHSRKKTAGYSSSENDEDDCSQSFEEKTLNKVASEKVPEGRKSWSQVPARSHLRLIASRSSEEVQEIKPVVPTYVHGQLIVRDVAVDVNLPLPLPLCRVLLLDSSSPVITKWEAVRGDTNYSKTKWTFPPASPREFEHRESEHKLIASGSMMGANRTTTYDRLRNGELVQLMETHIVDADDSEKVIFCVTERMPRRGFSVRIRISLHAINCQNCQATVHGEVRPMGKNMSNQAAVHRALVLVVDEIKMRYGVEGKGLLAGFLSVVQDLQTPTVTSPSRHHTQPIPANPQPTMPSQTQQNTSLHQQQTSLFPFSETTQPRRNPPNPQPQHHQSHQNNLQTMKPLSLDETPPRMVTPTNQAHQILDHFQRRIKTSAANVVSPSTSPSNSNASQDSLISFEDVLQARNDPRISSDRQMDGAWSDQQRPPTLASDAPQSNRQRPPTPAPDAPRSNRQRPPTPAPDARSNRQRPPTPAPDAPRSNRERPPTPVLDAPPQKTDKFGEFPKPPSNGYSIEVKPLPKIRLDLMPAPREEDEDEHSSASRVTRDSRKQRLLERRRRRRRHNKERI